MNVVTAGSPLVGTPINLVRGLIRLGLIKDLKLAITVHRSLEWLKKGLERKVELLGIEPRTFGLPCQCSATELQLPTATKGKKEGWLLLGVVAQWQSTGTVSQRSWVRFPAAPPSFQAPFSAIPKIYEQ